VTDQEKNLTAFMALAAQVEIAQKRMADQYREVQSEYERALNEATAKYQKDVAPVAPGDGAAAADDTDAAASGEPQTYEEGADEIYKDIGTASTA